MKSKHTPGQWRLDRCAEWIAKNVVGIIGANGRQVIRHGQTCTWSPTDADLALIMAAPELLEALKRAVNHLIVDLDRDDKGKQSIDTPEALEQARVAIAKAEGK